MPIAKSSARNWLVWFRYLTAHEILSSSFQLIPGRSRQPNRTNNGLVQNPLRLFFMNVQLHFPLRVFLISSSLSVCAGRIAVFRVAATPAHGASRGRGSCRGGAGVCERKAVPLHLAAQTAAGQAGGGEQAGQSPQGVRALTRTRSRW